MAKLAPLVFELASADIKSAVRRCRILAAFYSLAALFGFAGFLAFLLSAGLAMSRHMSPEAAALSIAGVLIALSLTVLAASSIWSTRERRKRNSKPAVRTIAIASALSVLPTLVKNRMGLGLMAAVVAGYFLASRRPVKFSEKG